jgi:hypothetical protein
MQLKGVIDSAREFRTNSILAVAGLNGDGSIIGLMERITNLHGGFTQNDQKLLELFAFFSEFSREWIQLFQRNRNRSIVRMNGEFSIPFEAFQSILDGRREFL